MSRILRAALEAETGVVKEVEMVFYGKIQDFSQLKAASRMLSQEQYEIQIPKTELNAVEGKLRIRKEVEEGKDPVYEFTTKTKTTDGHSIEVNCEATEANLIQFRYLSEFGMIKDRYEFPVKVKNEDGTETDTGLIWEIDVFKTANGSYHEWCKIDLEINSELKSIPAFPITLENLISAPYGERTEEEETIVRTLYDTVFRTPNPHAQGQKSDDTGNS